MSRRPAGEIFLQSAYTKPRKQKAHSGEWAKCLNLLVPLAGIELATFALRMRKKLRFSVLSGILGLY